MLNLMGVRAMRPAFAGLAAMLIGTVLGVSSCGGGSSNSGQSQAALAPTSVVETGLYTKVVKLSDPAVVSLFPDGKAFYSPDGFNLGGGGSTVLVSGGQQVADIVAVGTGVDALLADGSVFYSPDGHNLAGGGATVSAYEGA